MKGTLFSAFLLTMISWCGCSPSNDETLRIATAANMQFAMEEVVEAFSENTGITCASIVSSSGKLTAQIKEGAPFDVFVSADMKYPAELHQSGRTTLAPTIYAYGQLVMWSMDSLTLQQFVQLQTNHIKHLALANPKTAPYGAAAEEAVNRMGLAAILKDKLVFGESIAQTNQFILSKVADIGFTAKSAVLSPQVRNKGFWKSVALDKYTPIAQGIVLLNTRPEQFIKSRRFYQFLLGSTGKNILEKYGYTLPESSRQ